MLKKALKWLGRIVAALLIGVTVVPFILGLLALILFFIGAKFDLFDLSLNKSEAAVAALESTQLSAYTECAPYHSMSLGDDGVIFVAFKYDNHLDNTDLHAGIMAQAAITEGWHVEPVSPADYAARIAPNAAFLLPDATFDAWFESADDLAFFDQDTGLFVHLRKNSAAKAGTIRADKLTVPHNGNLYKLETHGGFHGDGNTYYALIVPEENRSTFEKALAAHADWHEGVVTNEEYRQLHTQRFFQALPLYPAADVTFEWYSFVDTYARMYPDEPPCTDRDAYFPAAMQELGACWSMNWFCALYDPDTGLFIFYQYDS